jgi:uncharacterized repeat protein (TIGR01451 family)
MSLRAMRAKSRQPAEPLEDPLSMEPPPPPRSGAPSTPAAANNNRTEDALPMPAENWERANGAATRAPMPSPPVAPSTEDVQVMPGPPSPNASRPMSAYPPDDQGRRPIADSSRPIVRDRNGMPLAEQPRPVPTVSASMPPAVEQPSLELSSPPAPARPAVEPSSPPAARTEPLPLTPVPTAPTVPMPMPAGPENRSPENRTPENRTPENRAPENRTPENRAPENRTPENRAPENRAPNPESAPTDPAAPRAPSPLLLEKIGPTTVNAGSPLAYELVIRNVTNAPLSHVRVEDDLPPGVQLLSAEPKPEVQRNKMVWNFAVLDPGTERRCKVQLMLTAVGEMNSCAMATFEVNACLRTIVTQPHLILKKTGPSTVAMGEKAVFQLELMNDGNGPATGVVLYDCLPEGLEHPQGPSIEAEIGTLGPGESKKLTLETRATKPGKLTNRAKATGAGNLCVTAEATVLVTAPALSLRKSGPRTRFIGREAEFDIEIQNPGSAPATNVQILDRIPQGLEFVSASDNGTYDPETRSVLWNLGTLNPGQREGISLKLVGKVEGDFINQAFARAEHNLEARAEAPIRIDGVAALMLEVVDLDDPVEQGNETVYEIHVINQGTSPCSRLQIVATAPEGMVPRNGTGPSAARISGQTVTFDPVDRLAAHADATYRVRVLCKTAGDWRFRVQMRCDQLRTPVLEEESTRIYADK